MSTNTVKDLVDIDFKKEWAIVKELNEKKEPVRRIRDVNNLKQYPKFHDVDLLFTFGLHHKYKGDPTDLDQVLACEVIRGTPRFNAYSRLEDFTADYVFENQEELGLVNRRTGEHKTRDQIMEMMNIIHYSSKDKDYNPTVSPHFNMPGSDYPTRVDVDLDETQWRRGAPEDLTPRCRGKEAFYMPTNLYISNGYIGITIRTLHVLIDGDSIGAELESFTQFTSLRNKQEVTKRPREETSSPFDESKTEPSTKRPREEEGEKQDGTKRPREEGGEKQDGTKRPREEGGEKQDGEKRPREDQTHPKEAWTEEFSHYY